MLEAQAELPRFYRTGDDTDLDFNQTVADDVIVTEAWTTWRNEVSHPQEVYPDLGPDNLVEVHGDEAESRDSIAHFTEEYARHVGPADLLRERIDGRGERTALPNRSPITRVAADHSAPTTGDSGMQAAVSAYLVSESAQVFPVRSAGHPVPRWNTNASPLIAPTAATEASKVAGYGPITERSPS